MKINKEDLINELLAKPYEVGEVVFIKGLGSQDKNAFFNKSEIINLYEDGIEYEKYGSLVKVPFDHIKRDTRKVGFNPFPTRKRDEEPQPMNLMFSSIMMMIQNDEKYKTDKGLTINQVNFNPFVEIDGEKLYYQRPYVWELEDKHLLLDSIFNKISCGLIIFRHRSIIWNNTLEDTNDTSFIDVVDGKQRLITMVDFVNDKFADRDGYYYSEYSKEAQNMLFNHQLFSYSEFKEDIKDEIVIKQFLKVNFSGKPQSKEHIEYVEDIYKKIK